MEDTESPMEEEPSVNATPVSEAELDRLTGVLGELHHLLETAPYTMVQPPSKAFPTTARITGPQERDDPYPALYRCKSPNNHDIKSHRSQAYIRQVEYSFIV